MRQKIEPQKWFRWSSGSGLTPLKGSVHRHGFEVSRKISYRNSFLPILTGRFVPTETGTIIRITMALHPLVMAFMATWFGTLSLFSVVGFMELINKGEWAFMLICGAMALFGGVLCCGCFWAEAGKTKELISQVLLGVETEAANMAAEGNGVCETPPPLPHI